MPNDLRKLIRSSFLHFHIQYFSDTHPGEEFLLLPVVRYLSYKYQCLQEGSRLVLNMPPRSGKSLMALAYSLWRIGNDPTEKILFISNNLKLAEGHIYDARKAMQSSWYKSTFPKTRIADDRSSLQHLSTTQGGSLRTGSMRTSLGGMGATIIIIDDGNRIDDADNPAALEAINNKFDGEILSRLNPVGKKKRRGTIINIQHRIAENDLSAHLITEGFDHVAFALEAPRTRTYHWMEDEAKQTWTRPKGHVLMENYSEEELEKARRIKIPPGHYFYQQAQGPDTATARFTVADFALADRRNSQGPFVISIDAAQGETASYNVAQVWDVSDKPLHLRRQFREQCGFHAFQLHVKKLITRWRPGAILVENAANGPALVSVLRHKLPSANFVMVDPRGSKAERLTRQGKAIASGAISVQQTEPWVDDYVNEFLHHPKLGSDQVDATTQLLDWRPEHRNIVAAESFFAGPAGVFASTMQTIRPHGYSFSSKTRGIARAFKRG